MIRPFAALAAFALLSGAAFAQDAAPAAPAAPADIVVDPAAQVGATPRQADMLTGFYATQAVIEICSVEIEPNVAEGMEADRQRLENALNMDAPTAETAYNKVKADVEKTTPDCAEGSPDRIGVDAVTAIYKAQSTTPAATTGAGTVSTEAPTPVEGEPVEPLQTVEE